MRLVRYLRFIYYKTKNSLCMRMSCRKEHDIPEVHL